jgi:hypothetical protein
MYPKVHTLIGFDIFPFGRRTLPVGQPVARRHDPRIANYQRSTMIGDDRYR